MDTANGSHALTAVDDQAAEHQPQQQSSEGSQRVCDRCISKKVKCDLQRPRCSRCLETDSECIYSAVKRRPGPRKGWTRSAKRPSHVNQPVKRPYGDPYPSHNHRGSDASVPPTILPQYPTPAARDGAWPLQAHISPYADNTSMLEPPMLSITPEQTRSLIDLYFNQDHHMIPLFNRQVFLEQFEAGFLPPMVYHTVAAVAAVIYATSSADRPTDARLYLETFLRSQMAIELEISFDVSLHEFQVLTMLAHYDFHQRPGPRSWVRVGNLTRKAYRLGLHQLENPPHCALYDSTGKLAEKEAWRRLWWSIYCLDSYSNITAGTPLIIELSSIRTAIPMFHDFKTDAPRCRGSQLVFLPTDIADVWETLQVLTSCGQPHEFDMHLAMATLVNESATCLRLCRQNPSKRLMLRIKTLEDNLTAARVALPPNYLDPVRRIWTNESGAQHHARLYNIVLLQSATIMLVLAKLFDAPEGEDAINWQRVLECCEDIVNAVKYWDSTKLTTADPAICFTFSGVLTLLHVCSKCSPVSTASAAAAELQASFDRQIRILKLYLEHFGTHWFLPRFLLASHEKLTQLMDAPMPIHEAKRVMQAQQTLLQQRWLSIMARVEQTEQDQATTADAVAFFNDWPLEEWLSDLITLPNASTAVSAPIPSY